MADDPFWAWLFDDTCDDINQQVPDSFDDGVWEGLLSLFSDSNEVPVNDNAIQNMNNVDVLFNAPTLNFGNNANGGVGEGAQGKSSIILPDQCSQKSGVGENSISQANLLPSQLSSAEGSILLPVEDHHPPHIFLAGLGQPSAENTQSSFNPLAEITQSSFNPLAEITKSSFNPLAEIFGARGSTILLLENCPSLLYGGEGSSIIPPADVRRSQNFTTEGESSDKMNPLAEIFRQRCTPQEEKDDHPSGHILKAGGKGVLESNHLPPFFEGESSFSPSESEQEGVSDNNTSLQLLDRLNRPPGQRIHHDCIGCHILTEVLYYNKSYLIRLQVHGRRGVIFHAIQERRPNVLHNRLASSEPPFFVSYDFSSKSLKDVKRFLTEDCMQRKRLGYTRQEDPVMQFYKGILYSGLEEDEWEDVLFYPEEYIPEKDEFGPLMQHQYADEASSETSSHAKRRRLTIAEQLESANMMNLEILRAYFQLTIVEAYEEMGLSIDLIKRLCRRFGINRWPGRKIATNLKMIKNLQPILDSYSVKTKEIVSAKITSLQKENHILMCYAD